MDSLHESQSFCTLLQSGLKDFTNTPSQPKMKSTKKTNFSIEEDIVLVKAWLNTSMDPIQGNDQKVARFWDRISESYHENKNENMVQRTAHSLSNRWSSIQKFINKFCGYFVQVETRNPSGTTEQDKINEAKEMYRKDLGVNFQFEHCWNLLKMVPKWNQLKTGVRTNSMPTSNSFEAVVNLEEDNDNEIVTVNVERPIGKKSAKERERKRKNQDCGDKGIVMEVLTELMEVKKRSYEERKKNIDMAKEEIICIEKQKIEIELRKEAREQQREEREIMMMDTRNLSAVQLEYFQCLQLEIMQKRLNK